MKQALVSINLIAELYFLVNVRKFACWRQGCKKTEVNVIFCNLCEQINGKCVDKIVSAANFAMYSSNSKCPQISSYAIPME